MEITKKIKKENQKEDEKNKEKEESVCVFVRIRGTKGLTESLNFPCTCGDFKVLDTQSLQARGRTMKFDRITLPGYTQSQIYDFYKENYIWSALNGYHSAFITNGDIKSGKTYTLVSLNTLYTFSTPND